MALCHAAAAALVLFVSRWGKLLPYGALEQLYQTALPQVNMRAEEEEGNICLGGGQFALLIFALPCGKINR